MTLLLFFFIISIFLCALTIVIVLFLSTGSDPSEAGKVLLLAIGGLLFLAIGYYNGKAETQKEAIKEGVATWSYVSDKQFGAKAEFKWIKPKIDERDVLP